MLESIVFIIIVMLMGYFYKRYLEAAIWTRDNYYVSILQFLLISAVAFLLAYGLVYLLGFKLGTSDLVFYYIIVVGFELLEGKFPSLHFYKNRFLLSHMKADDVVARLLSLGFNKLNQNSKEIEVYKKGLYRIALKKTKFHLEVYVPRKFERSFTDFL